MKSLLMAPAAVGLLMCATASTADCQRQERVEVSGARMQRAIDTAIRAGGSFLTPSEQAMVREACGYADGEWDGSDFNISNGVLICQNGRRVDSPEVRAMLEAAGPRIAQRVRSAMASPEVQSAIETYTQDVTERALRRMDDIPRRRPEMF